MSGRAVSATAMGLREQGRRPLLLALLVIVPAVFIGWSIWITQDLPRLITVPGDGAVTVTMRDLHGAVMVPISVAFLAGLVGVFLARSALESDRRLVLAGFRPGEVIGPRLVVLVLATLVVLTVALAVTSVDFVPADWSSFTGATLIAGLMYGALGALVGALLGRLGAAYVMFFAPMMDFGVAQNPMFFEGQPQEWARLLPGWGPMRVLIDGAFSATFDAFWPLVAGLGWLLVLGAAMTLLLRRGVAIAQTSALVHPNATGRRSGAL